MENQQKEIEELKLAVKMNTFSEAGRDFLEAGRVFDTVFKPPPTIVEEAEEEFKIVEEAEKEFKEEKTSKKVSCWTNFSSNITFRKIPPMILLIRMTWKKSLQRLSSTHLH